MNKTFLTAVSALALMVSVPAFAEDAAHTKAEPQPAQSSGSFSQDVEKAWDNTKQDVSEAAEKATDAVKGAYNDAKQAVQDDDNNMSMGQQENMAAAQKIIGEPVYNTSGERVAKVRDIILDQNGNAAMVVLADGDFTGLGKLVAFDYDVIATRNAEGDVISAVTEETMTKAASFSYNTDSYDENTRVIPNNGYSVAELMKGDIVSPEGESLANVDNIIFVNGRAEQLVVSFGETLGLGGEQAAIAYNETDVTADGDAYDFKLSANETMQFEEFKKKALN